MAVVMLPRQVLFNAFTTVSLIACMLLRPGERLLCLFGATACCNGAACRGGASCQPSGAGQHTQHDCDGDGQLEAALMPVLKLTAGVLTNK